MRPGDQAIEGADWRRLQAPPLRPGGSVRFSDLRDCRFDGMDLTSAEFVGCALNGASFRHADLSGAVLAGCFAADDAAPVDLEGASRDGLGVPESHLPGGGLDACWSPEAAAAALRMLSDDTSTRYRACGEIATAGDRRAALFTALLLADDAWEVRAAALDAIEALHGETSAHAPALLEWVFLRLGDPEPAVRQTAVSLLKTMAPGDDALRRSVGRMRSADPSERRDGVRAAIELARVNGRHDQLIDEQLVVALIEDPDAEVRTEAAYLIGVLGHSAPAPWRRALADQDPRVRVRALQGLRLLEEAPPADLLVPLLRDEEERVRMEALYTLGQFGITDEQVLEASLHDPSEVVRATAEQLLERR